MKWILIMILHLPGGAGNITTAEFYTKDACMAAGTEAQKIPHSHVEDATYYVGFKCVHVGDKERWLKPASMRRWGWGDG
jgi:hypothetical protein